MNKLIKTIALTITFVVGSNVQAQEMPKEFKGTRVQRVDANGKVLFDGSSEEWMIVRRKKKTKAPVVLAKSESKSEDRKNRLTLHGGIGTHGLSTSSNGNVVTVEERTRPVFGLSLSRKLDDRFSLSGTVLSNETLLLGIGLDY